MVNIPIPKPVLNRSGLKFLRSADARHLEGRSPHHFSVRDDDSWGRWLVWILAMLFAAVIGGFIAISLLGSASNAVFSQASAPEQVPAEVPTEVLAETQAPQQAAVAVNTALEAELRISEQQRQKNESRLLDLQASTNQLEQQLASNKVALVQSQQQTTLLEERLKQIAEQPVVTASSADIELHSLTVVAGTEKGRYRFTLKLQGHAALPVSENGPSNRLRLVILPLKERSDKWTYIPANAWKRSAGFEIKFNSTGEQILEGEFRLGEEFEANAVRIEIYGKNTLGYERLLRLRKPWAEVFKDESDSEEETEAG